MFMTLTNCVLPHRKHAESVLKRRLDERCFRTKQLMFQVFWKVTPCRMSMDVSGTSLGLSSWMPFLRIVGPEDEGVTIIRNVRSSHPTSHTRRLEPSDGLQYGGHHHFSTYTHLQPTAQCNSSAPHPPQAERPLLLPTGTDCAEFKAPAGNRPPN
jgi:hypothetical protein